MKRAKQSAEPDKPEKPKRDRLGRWIEGESGNRKGRPHKFARVDHGDVEKFKNSAIEVTMPDGRRVMMTREAAIQHRLYQSAMKGNVHALMFLARRFEKLNLTKAELNAGLLEMIERIRKKERAPTDGELWFMKSVNNYLNGVRSSDGPVHKVTVGRIRRRKTSKRSDDGEGQGPSTE